MLEKIIMFTKKHLSFFFQTKNCSQTYFGEQLENKHVETKQFPRKAVWYKKTVTKH